MNRREAGYVRHLIDHLLAPGSVDADDVEEAVVVLAALAHGVLGTGPDGPAVALLWEQSQQRDPTWTVAPADSPEVPSDADTIRQAASGWVVHPDIDCGTHRVVHVDCGRVAIRAICTSDGALHLASRQVRPGGDMENTTLVARVLVWLSPEEAL
jgi:hypothetical protein